MLFYQNSEGYCYNSDTKFLYDFISKFKPNGDVLDVGSGCGILGLLIAKDFKIKLSQIDIQKINCFFSLKNSQINNIDSQVINGDFLLTDFDKKFDFIISNPPFYNYNGTVGERENLNISRFNIYLPKEKFFKKVNSLLKPKGEFIFCYDSKQFREIIKLLEPLKMPIIDIRFIHSRVGANSHLVLIRVKKSSKSPLQIHSPLFIHKEGQFSNEVKKIFSKSRAYSIKCKI